MEKKKTTKIVKKKKSIKKPTIKKKIAGNKSLSKATSVKKSSLPKITPIKKKIIARALYHVDINPQLCKGCLICVEVCPRKVFDKVKKTPIEHDKAWVEATRITDCNACKICEIMCPDFAITIESAKKKI